MFSPPCSLRLHPSPSAPALLPSTKAGYWPAGTSLSLTANWVRSEWVPSLPQATGCSYLLHVHPGHCGPCVGLWWFIFLLGLFPVCHSLLPSPRRTRGTGTGQEIKEGWGLQAELKQKRHEKTGPQHPTGLGRDALWQRDRDLG